MAEVVHMDRSASASETRKCKYLVPHRAKNNVQPIKLSIGCSSLSQLGVCFVLRAGDRWLRGSVAGLQKRGLGFGSGRSDSVARGYKSKNSGHFL